MEPNFCRASRATASSSPTASTQTQCRRRPRRTSRQACADRGRQRRRQRRENAGAPARISPTIFCLVRSGGRARKNAISSSSSCRQRARRDDRAARPSRHSRGRTKDVFDGAGSLNILGGPRNGAQWSQLAGRALEVKPSFPPAPQHRHGGGRGSPPPMRGSACSSTARSPPSRRSAIDRRDAHPRAGDAAHALSRRLARRPGTALLGETSMAALFCCEGGGSGGSGDVVAEAYGPSPTV